MMVANRKLQDGENELITLTKVYPVWVGAKSLQHMFPDYHVGEGRLYGTLMRLRIYKSDRAKLLAAGYVPSDLLTESEVATRIDVFTEWDDLTGWRVGEVIPSTEIVRTEAERKAAWAADMAKYGGMFERTGLTELRFERLGESVVWSKDTAGRYVRTEGAGVAVFENEVAMDAEKVKALLIAAGLPSERIRKVAPTSGAWLRPGDGAQWSIVLDRAGNLGNVDKSAFTEWIADGSLIVVRVKVA